jgi:hypothetical protein
LGDALRYCDDAIYAFEINASANGLTDPDPSNDTEAAGSGDIYVNRRVSLRHPSEILSSSQSRGLARRSRTSLGHASLLFARANPARAFLRTGIEEIRNAGSFPLWLPT